MHGVVHETLRVNVQTRMEHTAAIAQPKAFLLVRVPREYRFLDIYSLLSLLLPPSKQKQLWIHGTPTTSDQKPA